MAITSKVDRVRAALAGEAVDRVPVSLWGHQYRQEWSARDLAEATVADYARYEWDYVKVTPRISAWVEDWGTQYLPSGNAFQPPRLAETKIREPRDLELLDRPRFDRGALAEHLLALRRIGHDLGRTVPFLQTIASPLALLGRLIGSDDLVLEWLAQEPRHVRTGLEVLTATFADYAAECLEAGAAGIFYSTGGWATRDRLTEDQYREFGTPHDRQILAAVGAGWFNVLHLGRPNSHFDLCLDYPVAAIHWASREPGNPTLDEGRAKLSDRVALMGGLAPETTLLNGSPEAIEREIRDAIERTERHHFLLAPEGNVSPRLSEANRQAVLDAVSRL